MVLLMLEAAGLYGHALGISESGSFITSIATQFTHAKWHDFIFGFYSNPVLCLLPEQLWPSL